MSVTIEDAKYLIQFLNIIRQLNGLNPLYAVPYLNERAVERITEASTSAWGHTRPNGEDFTTIVDKNIINYSDFKEIILTGRYTDDVFGQLYANPSIWNDRVLGNNYTHMGIGLIYNTESLAGAQYYTCIFLIQSADSNAEYEGQYLDGTGSLALTVNCIDSETKEPVPDIKIQIRRGRIDSSDESWDPNNYLMTNYTTTTQNDIQINPDCITGKCAMTFNSGNYSTVISGLIYGEYYVSIDTLPIGCVTAYSNMTGNSGNPNFTIGDSLSADATETIDLEIIINKFTFCRKSFKTGEILSGGLYELSIADDTSLADVLVSCDSSVVDNKITFRFNGDPVTFTKVPNGKTLTIKEIEAPEGQKTAGNAVFSVYNTNMSLNTDSNIGGAIEDKQLVMMSDAAASIVFNGSPGINVKIEYSLFTDMTSTYRDLSEVTAIANDEPIEVKHSYNTAEFTIGDYPVTVSEIPPGRYSINVKNTLAPTAISGLRAFIVSGDGSVSNTYNYAISEITFTAKDRDFTFLKVDGETGKFLAGANLRISSNVSLENAEISHTHTLSEDKKSFTFTSTTNALVVSKIPYQYGTEFTIEELSAPEGYNIAEPTHFIITESGSVKPKYPDNSIYSNPNREELELYGEPFKDYAQMPDFKVDSTPYDNTICKQIVKYINTYRVASGYDYCASYPYTDERSRMRAEETVQRNSNTRPNGQNWNSLFRSPDDQYINIATAEIRWQGDINTSAKDIVDAIWSNSTYKEELTKERSTWLSCGIAYNEDKTKIYCCVHVGAIWASLSINAIKTITDYQYFIHPFRTNIITHCICKINRDISIEMPNVNIRFNARNGTNSKTLSSVGVYQNASAVDFMKKDSYVKFNSRTEPITITNAMMGYYTLDCNRDEYPAGILNTGTINVFRINAEAEIINNNGEIGDANQYVECIVTKLYLSPYAIYQSGYNKGRKYAMYDTPFTLTYLGDCNLGNVFMGYVPFTTHDRFCMTDFVQESSNTITFTNIADLGIYRLPVGDYVLHNIEPPAGYYPIEDITFTIDAEGNITNVVNAELSESTATQLNIKFDKILGAFQNATNLKEVDIPKSVKSIGIHSFENTALNKVQIAKDCTYSDTSFPKFCNINFYPE